MGPGGYFTAQDAYDKIRAGASLVEVYTGLIYEGPGMLTSINKGLQELLKRDGYHTYFPGNRRRSALTSFRMEDKWMDGRDWKKFLLPYEQAVEELKVKFKTLRGELKSREEYAPIEFVTGRVKKISSVLEKAKRLSVPMDQLESGIEDIAGIRIMCQFVEDIDRLAELIRSRQDMSVVYEKDYITNKKPSGYRSFHIIIEYPVQTALGMKRILAEVQIRTLAMNFWATIEHSLNYKYKEQLPSEVRARLVKRPRLLICWIRKCPAFAVRLLRLRRCLRITRIW